MGCGFSAEKQRIQAQGPVEDERWRRDADDDRIAYMRALVVEARTRRHRLGDYILAPDVFSVFLPTCAVVPAALFAAYTYTRVDLVYRDCGEDQGPPSLDNVSAMGIPLRFPFAALTGVCYIGAGLGPHLVAFFNRAFPYPPMHTLSTLLVIFGHASTLRHALGASEDSWEAGFESVCAAGAFAVAASIATAGVVYAAWGRTYHSAQLLPVLLNVFTWLLVLGAVVVARILGERTVVVALGSYLVLAAAVQRALLTTQGLPQSAGRLTAVLAVARDVLSIVVPRLAVFASAIVLLDAATDVARLEDVPACGDLDPASAALRIDGVQRIDWMQGTWHYLSACLLLASGLTSSEGLGGRPLDRRTERGDSRRVQLCCSRFESFGQTYAEELVCRVIIAAFAVCMASIHLGHAPSAGWRYAWLFSAALFLPWWAVLSVGAVLRHARIFVQDAEELVRKEDEEIRLMELELTQRIQNSPDPDYDLMGTAIRAPSGAGSPVKQDLGIPRSAPGQALL